MSDDEPLDRTKVTFAQAEGAEELPTQLELKQVSPLLKSLLWRQVYEFLGNATSRSIGYGYPDHLHEDWKRIFFDWHTIREHKPADEFRNNPEKLINKAKSYIYSDNYIDSFDFIQFVLRHPKCPYNFEYAISSALKHGHAAYTIFEKSIIPAVTEQEKDALISAYRELDRRELPSAKNHLRAAVNALNTGDYSSSIRESIHSVESVARTLEKEARTLGPALKKLREEGMLHPALEKGLSSLYGYTNDQQGIRHALITSGSPNVDETDALFMLGACASFVTYLARKSSEFSEG